MENKLVIGILGIVEDKLREFGIMLPDDDREDSKDPIVGYQYAELHDRIKEYLEDAGVMGEGRDFVRTPEKKNVYGISIVNSLGFFDDKESYVQLHGSLRESLDYAYARYQATWQDLKDNGELRGAQLKPQCVFEAQLMQDGCVCIQLADYHIQFERFEQEVEFAKDISLASRLRSAMDRASDARDTATKPEFEY